MDEKELRIGNYVNIEDTVLRVDLQELYYNSSLMNPIPLTEEWLLKFNLNNPTNKHPYHFKKSMVEFLHSEYQNELKCFYNNVPMFSLPCTYVHQLQNLYFALTGEEL